MENEEKTPILNIAWARFAHFDQAAKDRSRENERLRKWIAALGVFATLFAILTQLYPQDPTTIPLIGPYIGGILGLVLKVLLIITPIAASVLAAFTNKFFGGGDWLVMRAGAENILKEIFVYRTILKGKPDKERRDWLERRLVDIQRQVYSGLGGEMVLKPYNGPLPPYDNPDDPADDSGFNDLDGNQYFQYRVVPQLAWHMKKVRQRQEERVRLQVYILLAGGAGAFLAAWGAPVSLWVALTASLTAALIGWQELRSLDAVVKNYSKVILELMHIYDHWNNLKPEERTDAEFFDMVGDTEELLWSQNAEYIKVMQEALSKNKPDQSMIDDVLKASKEEAKRLQDSMRDTIVSGTRAALTESTDQLAETFKETFGSLSEEASSPLVQAEFQAMEKAAAEAAETARQGMSRLNNSLKEIASEFSGINFSGDTPVGTLNSLLVRYPPTEEIKG